MIQTIRRKRADADEGFTLIELMVVVLIIAILLAIAIPTFLGARGRAQNRAAESNLRNALTASKTGYTDNQTYYSATSSLSSIEPSLNWVTVSPAANGNQVEVSTGDANIAGNTVCLVAQSASGMFYAVFDVAQVEATNFLGAGTFYGSNSGSAPSCPTATTAGGTVTASTGTWSSSSTGANW